MSNSTKPDIRELEPDDPDPSAPRRRRSSWFRWALVVVLLLAGVIAYPLIDQTIGPADPPVEPSPDPPTLDPGTAPEPEALPTEPDRLLYSRESLERYRSGMAIANPGPYFSAGDAGHGGEHSPGDGREALRNAERFLEDPEASYWRQPDLPYGSQDPYPSGMDHARPMHAAWVFMTQQDHPQREALRAELTSLLLTHATDPTLDFSDAGAYPADFPGSAQGPIFLHAQWMTRLIKTRDMLGRELFTEEQNLAFDRWIFGYANWSATWLHNEVYGKALPGRADRDYSEITWPEDAERISYDGGPRIGSAGMAYTNRHAAVASSMSLAVNYLAYHGHDGSTVSEPDYGVKSMDEVLDQSRLFVEETLRFSVWPEGFQGDFERGNADYHDASEQQGWLYSVNVLANLMEIAEYHAKRGDMSVWDYGTTEGYDGSDGVPVEGGFEEKNLHFFAWAMSRYVNGGWDRTNYDQPLALPEFYHDVIPAAAAHRFAPDDDLLEAAWRREGEGFPVYPSAPESQGPFQAHVGEGGKMIGLIEHALGSDLER